MRALTVFGFLLASPAWAGSLTLSWTFTHVEEGYDHLNKMQVYANGELVGESPEAHQTEKQSFTVQVPDEAFELRVVNLALYEGNWEEHTVENNYSIDCTFEQSLAARKKHKFKVLYDVDSGATIKGR